MISKKGFGTGLRRTKGKNLRGSDTKGTTNIGSRSTLQSTHGWREKSTGYPLAIFKHPHGSMSTMSTRMVAPASLTTMVSISAISLVLVTLAQLLLVYITLIQSSTIAIILLSAVILINVICILRMLRAVLAWWSGATKDMRKAGRGRRTTSGGTEWFL